MPEPTLVRFEKDGDGRTSA